MVWAPSSQVYLASGLFPSCRSLILEGRKVPSTAQLGVIYPPLNPRDLPSEVLRSLWQGWSVRGYLSTPQRPPVWTECYPLPQGRGHGYTRWPISTPQLIGPGWTPDPNQANWVLYPGNPTLGPKGIDFKWQPSVLQCGGHRWRIRGWWGRGWAGPSLSCQPLGRLSCSALSWVLVSLQRPLYLYHEHFHSLSLLPVVANLGRFLLLLITQIFVLL